MLKDNGCKIGFIYGLIEPQTGCIRYVGKTTQLLRTRIALHMRGIGNYHTPRWIRSLKRRGLKPEVVALAAVSIDAINDAERWWIRHCRENGASLTNMTDGGDGLLGLHPDSRAAISAKLKGRRKTPEQIERSRAALIGRKLTEEHRRHMSSARKGVRPTPEQCLRLRGRPRSPNRGRSGRPTTVSDSTKERMRANHRRLTGEDVLRIRYAYASGESAGTLAGRYGLGAGAVRKIVGQKTWKHVPGAESGEDPTHYVAVLGGNAGARSPAAKLSNEDVIAIRAECASGTSRQMLAEWYGVTVQSIHNIIHNVTWK